MKAGRRAALCVAGALWLGACESETSGGEADAAPPAVDASPVDATPPASDVAIPAPDEGVVSVDEGITGDDAAPPDAAEPELDAAAPDPDAAPDAGPEPDAAIPEPDAAIILPDMAPPPPPDDDGDGYDATVDCDDDDPLRNPGMPDIPNRIDDDCDGRADEIRVCADGTAPYGSVQEAVQQVPEGTVVELCPGVFDENVTVRRRVTLWGSAGAEATIIDGGQRGSVITVDQGGRLTLENVQLRNGRAAEGGGLRCETSQISLRGAVLAGNFATQGGGLNTNDCTVAIDGIIARDNQATAQGGGARFDNSRGVVANSRFADNDADFGGGVASVEGEVDLSRNEMVGNHALHSGGGAWHNSNATFSGNTVTDNVADGLDEAQFGGGGLYVDMHAPQIIDNSFERNFSGNDGGGVFLKVSQAYFGRNQVLENEAADDAGGLRVFTSRLVVELNQIIGNRAGDDGGGLKLSHAASEVLDNLLEDNFAGDAAGGLEIDNDQSHVRYCVVRNNRAGRGAGIHVSTAHNSHLIEDTTVENNQAAGCGGGMLADREVHTFEVRRVTFSGNTASQGAAICASEIDILVTNSIFDGHESGTSGGSIYATDSAVRLVHSVIANSAAPSGAALFTLGGSLDVSGLIIYAAQGDAAVVVGGELRGWRYSDVFDAPRGMFRGMVDPTGTNGNISADPLFADPAASDFHLLPGSPALNAGDPALMDRDGTRADMGAFAGPLAE